MKKITVCILVLALSAALLVGCAYPAQKVALPQESKRIEVLPELSELAAPVATGGVLRLKINPEIAVHYDETGKVTKLEGRNLEGVQILGGFTGYEGKETAQVLEDLVTLIGKAGYFVEEADGTARKIVLELDPGSQVPSDRFLEDMAQHVKLCVESRNWIGEREDEYEQQPTSTEPAPAQPASAATVPAGLCPVCADDDCDEGKYCGDGHEKAENLREYERLMSGDVCSVCADPDCDDGKYCDDADEKKENQAENAAKKAAATTGKATSAKKKTTKCAVCGDTDCDDGKYCDDWDDDHDDHDDHDD